MGQEALSVANKRMEFTVKSSVGVNVVDQFLCGNAVDVARELPDSIVDTIVTSPPYYRQRDYGSVEQLSLIHI